MKRNYLVGYDISDSKRLKKTAKIVEQFGVRMQYSFFHCTLSEPQRKRLKRLIQATIKENEDQVFILPITPLQLKEMEFIGLKCNLRAEGIFIV